MMLTLILASQTYDKPLVAPRHRRMLLSFLQILCASLFLGLCAQISIPLYFSPVPLTGQTFGVMLIGAMLGRKRGTLTLLMYLLEGALGLPVFAGGAFGLLKLIGPTGGYFMGMVAEVYLIGWFFETQRTFNSLRTFGKIIISSLIQLSLGVIWLIPFVGLQNVLMMGFFPFVLGEIFKALALTTFFKSRS